MNKIKKKKQKSSFSEKSSQNSRSIPINNSNTQHSIEQYGICPPFSAEKTNEKLEQSEEDQEDSPGQDLSPKEMNAEGILSNSPKKKKLTREEKHKKACSKKNKTQKKETEKESKKISLLMEEHNKLTQEEENKKNNKTAASMLPA